MIISNKFRDWLSSQSFITAEIIIMFENSGELDPISLIGKNIRWLEDLKISSNQSECKINSLETKEQMQI